MTKPRLTFSQIINMNVGFFGIQYSFGLQQSAVNPIYDMLGATPGDAALWHETGLVHVGLDNLRAGVMCLEQALALVEAPGAKNRIAMEIQALKSRLN